MERRNNRASYKTEGNKLYGYAAVWDAPTVIREAGKTFTEIIRKGAFKRSLGDSPDIICCYNHDTNKLLGRMSAKTLTVKEDNTGLLFEVELPDTPTGNEVRTLAARGDLSGASFAFSVPKGGDRWTGTQRELLDLELFECGPVVTPAYSATVVGLRNNRTYYEAKLSLYEKQMRRAK